MNTFPHIFIYGETISTRALNCVWFSKEYAILVDLAANDAVGTNHSVMFSDDLFIFW